MTSEAAGTEGKENKMARLSAQREHQTEESRDAWRSLIKTEKRTGPKTNPCGKLWRNRKKRILRFKKSRKHARQKEKLNPSNKARREAIQNKPEK